MPPNRFESEVESFLEGSHGDRTHIKRADHPRLHHYAGRYCIVSAWQSGITLVPASPGEAGAGHAHPCGYWNTSGRICVMVARHS